MTFTPLFLLRASHYYSNRCSNDSPLDNLIKRIILNKREKKRGEEKNQRVEVEACHISTCSVALGNRGYCSLSLSLSLALFLFLYLFSRSPAPC